MDKKENAASRASVESFVPRLRWPRGRYNGRRIMGASIKFKFSVKWFEWWPKWIRYAHCFRWLWFYVWMEWEYE
jgi:hypothetical protein